MITLETLLQKFDNASILRGAPDMVVVEATDENRLALQAMSKDYPEVSGLVDSVTNQIVIYTRAPELVGA